MVILVTIVIMVTMVTMVKMTMSGCWLSKRDGPLLTGQAVRQKFIECAASNSVVLPDYFVSTF
jgi:hypothetical protein